MKKFMLKVEDHDFELIKQALMENDCLNGKELDVSVIKSLFFIDEREGEGQGFDLTCRVIVKQIEETLNIENIASEMAEEFDVKYKADDFWEEWFTDKMSINDISEDERGNLFQIFINKVVADLDRRS